MTATNSSISLLLIQWLGVRHKVLFKGRARGLLRNNNNNNNNNNNKKREIIYLALDVISDVGWIDLLLELLSLKQ